jgi:glyceraldehyde 3-phosphate dehydrogenase
VVGSLKKYKEGAFMKIALNGFGRIGRNFLRSLFQDKNARKKLDIVAINIGPASPHFVAHSFKYDTLMGAYQGEVFMSGNTLTIDGTEITILTETDPDKLPWKALSIDWVVEASGKFTKKEDAQKHSTAGAKGVLISAPSQDADATIIMGFNQDQFNKETDKIVSLGSCTTNALVPVLDVLQKTFGIESAYMTTIHSYTNNQALLDVERSDVRRGRAAALNIIPTTTGAMKVVDHVMPELAGKIKGCSLRVPVAKVSLIDLAFVAQKQMTPETIHTALINSKNPFLKVTDKPLVSTDYSENDASVVVDGLLTEVTGNLGKLFGWYDNEWAYSCRLKDFLLYSA